ncbi:hypothetical protein SAMN05880566_102205 [Janthinobacterium sp. TND4EL3]|uniref:DUF1566 domain-containing protein n=1 Tax=Janthinobacterium sp. TND4EL3 TaxID=1907311 RepID=UPI0009570EE2|nr:DUF1566 domain-containing protein [Janthinobacterium sp. TND4EL3]SIQ21296.1 hypothetical protein SAMN05880566_102205 [Janthinobacterium sp. TND4EL3]
MSAAILALPAEHANIIFDALIDSRCFNHEMGRMPGADLRYWEEKKKAIDAAYFALQLATGALPNVATTASITIGAAFAGGIYAGISRGVDGAPDEHLVLLPGEAVDIDWEAAGTFAASAGGVLPTRAEQALLYENLKHEFEPNWYWSSEQAGPSDAWFQYFYYGYQLSYYRSYEGRARAVRRLPI